jgi:hypothetical protein
VHVRWCRDPVDVDHVVFPLDAASIAGLLVAVVRSVAALALLGVFVLPALGALLVSVRLCGLAVTAIGVSFVPGVVSMSVVVTGVLILRAVVAVLMTLVVAVAIVGVRAVL